MVVSWLRNRLDASSTARHKTITINSVNYVQIGRQPAGGGVRFVEGARNDANARGKEQGFGVGSVRHAVQQTGLRRRGALLVAGLHPAQRAHSARARRVVQ